MRSFLLKRKKFVTYCFFGFIAAIFDLGLFQLLISYGKLSYIIATPISSTLGITVNYILQRKFTFKNKYLNKRKQFLVFLVVSIGGILINWIGTIAYAELLGMPPIIARLAAVLTAAGYNYFVNKKITFGKLI